MEMWDKKLLLRELADQVLLLPSWYDLSNVVLQMYRDAGVTPKVLHTSALPQEAGAMLVTSGKGIYVLPGTAVSYSYYFGIDVAVVPLEESPSVEVHMAWRKGEVSLAVLNFVDTVRKVFQSQFRGRPASA